MKECANNAPNKYSIYAIKGDKMKPIGSMLFKVSDAMEFMNKPDEAAVTRLLAEMFMSKGIETEEQFIEFIKKHREYHSESINW